MSHDNYWAWNWQKRTFEQVCRYFFDS